MYVTSWLPYWLPENMRTGTVSAEINLRSVGRGERGGGERGGGGGGKKKVVEKREKRSRKNS